MAGDPNALQTRVAAVVSAYNTMISIIHNLAGFGTQKPTNQALAADSSLLTIAYANRHNDMKAIDEVIRVMTPIREAFTLAVRSLVQPPLELTGSNG